MPPPKPQPAFHVPGLARHKDLEAAFKREVSMLPKCIACQAAPLIQKYAQKVRQREGTPPLRNG